MAFPSFVIPIFVSVCTFFCVSCSIHTNNPPKADEPLLPPLSGVFVCDSDTMSFNGDGESVNWHFSQGMDSVGLQGSGTYVFLFNGGIWRYDSAERFNIYTSDKKELAFGVDVPGSCNDTTISIIRFDLPNVEMKHQVFKKVH